MPQDMIGPTGSSEHLLPYADRLHAGKVLAQHLQQYAGQPDLLVLGLARGGLPVADEVARALGAELDAYVVRKLGVPRQEELAMGAIAHNGVRVLNPEIIKQLAIPAAVQEDVAQTQLQELQRREQMYRGSLPFPLIEGRTVIVVDDGIATGASLRAALVALRQQGPGRLIAAVPVGEANTCQSLRENADDVVCAAMPQPFNSVGRWYEDFPQVSDEEVNQHLAEAREASGREPD